MSSTIVKGGSVQTWMRATRLLESVLESPGPEHFEVDVSGTAIGAVGECGDVSTCRPDWENAPKLYRTGGKSVYSCRPAAGKVQRLVSRFRSCCLAKCWPLYNGRRGLYEETDMMARSPWGETRSQLFLAWPSNINVDCWFGTQTERALKGFQAAVFEDPSEWDGVVGRKTWDALRHFDARDEQFLVPRSVSSGSAAKRPRRAVSVHIKVYHGTTPGLRLDLDIANRVFAQANVAVRIASHTRVSASLSRRVLGRDNALDHQRPDRRTPEELRLLGTHNHPGEIEAHFARFAQAGHYGFAYDHPGEPATIVVSRGDKSPAHEGRTFAHELGHILTRVGDHHPDGNNFLATNGGRGKDLMDTAQIARIQSSPHGR